MNFDVPGVLLSLTIDGAPAMLVAVQFVPSQGERAGKTDVFTPGGMFTVDQSPEEVAKAWSEAEALEPGVPPFESILEEFSKSLGLDVAVAIQGSGMLPEDLSKIIREVFPNDDAKKIDGFTKMVFANTAGADRKSLHEYMKRRGKSDEPEDEN